VNDIACRVSEPKSRHRKRAAEAGRKEVTGFMNDDAGNVRAAITGPGMKNTRFSPYWRNFAAAEKMVVLLLSDDLSRIKPILN
jgi:hypothetical protein